MSFLAPWYWVLLAPLGGIIILLYLLKLRRTPLLVSSVMLWERLVADMQANAPFQRLRANLLLFLQLAALLALVMALARPFVVAPGLEGQSVVLVIDTSGSMGATDVRGGRFAQARQAALRAVDLLGRGDTMSVIAASARTQVVAPFTGDRKALAAAIRSLECTDTEADIPEALRLADSLCTRKRQAQIVLISDGAWPSPRIRLGNRCRVTFTRVGRRGDNVAIAAVGARHAQGERAGHSLFVGTRNYSARRQRFAIELWAEGTLIAAREQTLAPHGRGAEVFALPATAKGLVTVRLDARDDLAADNQASLFLTPPTRATVLLLGGRNVFLERALVLDPALEVSAQDKPGSGYHDLVVVEGNTPGRLPPARGYLFLGAAGPQAPVTLGRTLESPSLVDWRRDHPVTRALSLEGVRIAQGRVGVPRPWAQSLAECEGGSLLAAGEHEGVRVVYVGWDVLQSDFPLRVAWPIFISNCVDWLARPQGGGGEPTVRPGETVTLPLPGSLERVTLRDPGGRRHDLPVAAGRLLVSDTTLAGVYEVTAKGLRRRFAVNALGVESDLRPRGRLALGGPGAVRVGVGTVRSNRELWRLLVLAALVLMTLEWFAFHRRP